MAATLKRSFPPIVDAETRLLLLGSLPGEQSLAQARYYANPRNQFWTLIGAAIGVDLAALDYAERIAALRCAHVGLWDVVESAARSGSLDGSIRAHRPNRLAELVAGLPQLRAVAFNGGTAARIGRKALAGTAGIALIDLPSSSPAYTKSLADKRLHWQALRDFLTKGDLR